MLDGIISDFLYKTLPMLVSMGLAMLLYFWIDKNINLTDWISKRIKTNDDWKPLVGYLFMFLIVCIFGLAAIFIIDMPPILYFIICGLLTGIGFSYINNFNVKRKKNHIF